MSASIDFIFGIYLKISKLVISKQSQGKILKTYRVETFRGFPEVFASQVLK